jgi:hypothetical protein
MSPPLRAPVTPVDVLSAVLGSVIRDHFTLFLSEAQSHLGVDGHRSAVLRRIACGESGAVLADGKYLLSLEAHDEEFAMALQTRPRPKMPSEPPKGGAHAG